MIEPMSQSQVALRPLSILMGLLKGVRPKQATKNLFVYMALIFGGKLFALDLFLRATAAFLLFTAVAGSVYLLNDILDVEADRQHPEKRRRPIASGELPVGVAWVALFALAAGGLAVGFWVRPLFGLALAAYLGLQVAYCFRLKHMVLLDVFSVAAGFVLRTVAGALIIHVPISQWLLLCTLQLALFLGFGKRRQELVLMGQGAGKSRAILNEYSLPFLDQIINIVSGITIVSYSVYTIESVTAQQHPHLWMTVPFVVYGVFRYLYLVFQKGWGGAPDEVLLKDRALQVAILLWLATVVLLFAYDAPGKPFLGLE